VVALSRRAVAKRGNGSMTVPLSDGRMGDARLCRE
jgi:hypothetical protein